MSPVSSAICNSRSCSRTTPSSMSSSSATLAICLKNQRTPAMGPVIGNTSRLSMISIQARGQHNRTFAGPLQLEPDVDEVVWWPGAGVAEGQLALVLAGYVLHFGVEPRRLFPLYQE